MCQDNLNGIQDKKKNIFLEKGGSNDLEVSPRGLMQRNWCHSLKVRF